MKRLIPLVLILSVIVLLPRCYYNSEEYLYPEITNCDTTNVTYSLSVAPIIQTNCFTCHSNSAAASFGGNIKLQDYADVKIKADDGKLMGSIKHEPGFIAMPQGGKKLDDCSISTIQKWIDKGVLNN